MQKLILPAVVLVSIFVASTALSQNDTGETNQENQPTASQQQTIVPAKLGETRNVHRLGELYFAGQIPKADIPKLKKNKFGRVITLRTQGEIDWDEKSAVESTGLEYVEIPFGKPETLTDEVFDTVRKTLANDKERTLFHCGSANRVGGVWLTYRVLDQGVELETAIEEAKTIGLRSAFIKLKAYDYIQRKLAARNAVKENASVKPGINKPFLAKDLDVDAFIKRFEMESREVYDARERILAACEIKPGSTVADIGAGTGLYTRIFSIAVGETGWVYAVDIAPRFLKHINRESKKLDQHNVTSVLGSKDSVNLPPKSCDIVFVCDTYHHFEYPDATLKSIRRALKSDGRLVVIDFDRIEGKSREWLLGHIRAGKAVFRSEIEDAGFELSAEKKIAGLEENYFLMFKKK
jgi:SAM-dependent methyltransferase/protein tyrosine phosphatase (PTP) superfamily phosphohydrolase (DUF442 family)